MTVQTRGPLWSKDITRVVTNMLALNTCESLVKICNAVMKKIAKRLQCYVMIKNSALQMDVTLIQLTCSPALGLASRLQTINTALMAGI